MDRKTGHRGRDGRHGDMETWRHGEIAKFPLVSLSPCLLVFLSVALWLCGSVPGLAQPQSTPPPSGSFEAALGIEDPTARIEALQQFLQSNNAPERVQAAREAIVRSYAQLAEIQLRENNIERAVAGFRKAIDALPENINDRFFGETVLRMPQTVSLRGYRIEAIDLARRLERRFAEEPRRLGGLGEFYMAIEAPIDAIRALETAVRLGSEASLHRLLGAAYRIGLRLDDAVAEIQHAIKIDPTDSRCYYELANLYRALGAYSDAINLYKKQLEIDPKHSPSYKGLALTYLAKGDEANATAALDQARKLRGAPEEITKDNYLQTQMAFYYLEQGKLKQARAAADAALSVEPRYAWARIAAAEVDLAEGKYFDAERNLLAAQRYAGFPTLLFTVGKLYLAVEDFEGAQDQFAKAFNYSPQKQFTARLGGVLEVQAESLMELFSREHQAAIFLADPPTTSEQFKMIESLVRFNATLRALKSAGPPRPGKTKIDIDARRKRLVELDRAATDFSEAERTRRPFRTLYIAQQLANAGVMTGTAIELADQALSMAETATEFDGSLRDYPNYDREGRLMIFRGRALDAKGWALFKSERNQEAIGVLSEAVKAYGSLPESKRAIRHLAMAREAAGELREALDLYLAGYEPPSSPSSLDVDRVVIEGLYRKVHGSLDGLDQRLKGAGNPSLSALLASIKPLEKEAAPSNNGAGLPGTPPPPVPIVLPAIKSNLKPSILPVLPIEQKSLLPLSNNLSIESEEPPPPPPQFEIHTRKRRATVSDPLEPRAEPRGEARKRRVTAPARQMRRKR
jgi:tetratricopeptide (TPR) repeat protein